MKIECRRAIKSDSEAIFNWRNDEASISNSFSSDPVKLSDHNRWFASVLENKNTRLFIGLIGKTKKEFGVVRFETAGDGVCEVSINLAPEWRGKRLSSALLIAGMTQFSADFDSVYFARIKASNFTSQKCFERAGFSLYREVENMRIYVNKQKIIDKVEEVRSRNNVNWMNLMRLAFKVAPEKAEDILGDINSDDATIAKLLDKLTRKIEI
jgi:RimJ/RimL family protein N-acetyltransferase